MWCQHDGIKNHLAWVKFFGRVLITLGCFSDQHGPRLDQVRHCTLPSEIISFTGIPQFLRRPSEQMINKNIIMVAPLDALLDERFDVQAIEAGVRPIRSKDQTSCASNSKHLYRERCEVSQVRILGYSISAGKFNVSLSKSEEVYE